MDYSFKSISNKINANIDRIIKGTPKITLNSILKKPDIVLSDVSLDLPVFRSLETKFKKCYIGLNFEFIELFPTLSVIFKHIGLNNEFNDFINNVKTENSLGYFLRNEITNNEKSLSFYLKKNHRNEWECNAFQGMPEIPIKLEENQSIGKLEVQSTCNAFISQTKMKSEIINFWARLIGFDGGKSFGNIAMVIYSDDILNQNEIDLAKGAFEMLSYQCLEVLSLVKSTLLEKSRELERNSQIQIAIAAIMARNMSHNIGSHVITALSTNYNLPFNDRAFYRYIQHRMDFIAQITTEWPSWTYPVWFVRDLMRRFYIQHNLLNYIVNSEGLKAHKFQPEKNYSVDTNNSNFSLNELIILIEKCEKDKTINKIVGIEDYENDILSNDQDTLISIPGGLIGYHAFYIILENFIRNIAKHDRSSETNLQDTPKSLDIVIRFYDEPEKSYTRFFIYSNAIPPNHDAFATCDIINEKLALSFVNDNGELEKKHWGLSEMKIACGYLNLKEKTYIGESNLKYNESIINGSFKINGLIHARIDENDNEKWGYELSIPKSKEIQIVLSENNCDINSETLTICQKHGIYITSIRNLHSTDCELVVFEKFKDLNEFCYVKENIEQLPIRIICLEPGPDLPSALYQKYAVLNFSDVRKKIQELTIGNIELNFYRFKLELFQVCVENFIGIFHKLQQIIEPKEYKLYGNTSGGRRTNIFSNELNNIILDTLKKHDNGLLINKLISYSKTILLNDNDLLLLFHRAFNSKFLTQEERDICLGVYYSVHTLFKKYEEDIDTLPRIYRASNQKAEEMNHGDIFNDDDYFLPKSIQLTKLKIEADIVLDRHSKLGNDVRDKLLYAESLSGTQVYFNLLLNHGKSEYAKYLNNKTIMQIIENAFSSMTIIDERFYEFHLKSDDSLKNRLDKAKIFISVNPEEFISSKDKISFLKKYSCIFLIIHQGILDKIFQGNTIDRKKNISEFLTNLKRHFPFVIITSGRGMPENVPNDVKFIPYSILSETLLLNYHEKYLLTNILFKSTTSTN